MWLNCITLPVTILFIVNGCGQLYYALKLYGQYPKQHNIYNSVTTCILWIIAGLLYPLYFYPYSSSIETFQWFSLFFICIFTPFMIILVLAYQYFKIIKKNPEIKVRRNITLFLNKSAPQEQGSPERVSPISSHTLRIDIYRKLLHLFPAAVIIILWWFAVYIWDGLWNADLFWNISGEAFGRFLIITAGYSGILVFAALDYIRLSYIFKKRNLFHFIPNNVLDLLTKSMKQKEVYEFTKPVALVLAYTPIFFLPFGIFASAALISTLGDGAASLLGLKFGAHHFPKNSQKTVVGYISGMITSIGVSIISLFIFDSNLNFIEILLLSLLGGVIFLSIDLFIRKVDDNILNPLFCGGLMGLCYYLLI